MERIIGKCDSGRKGPLLIFVAGIHGNEPQGLIALENIIKELENGTQELHGRMIALRGNLKAIEGDKRFISKDLNRIWSHNENLHDDVWEMNEMAELKLVINKELALGYTKVYLIDLHTTSAPTIPFVVTKDRNQDKQLIHDINVPFITGLEGHLDGTMLSWMCKKGHCGLAFEAGQHHSRTSMIKHESFVKLAMYYTGFTPNLTQEELKDLRIHLEDELKPKHNHFRLMDHYYIQQEEVFEMEPGFSNFERIYAGEILAKNQEGEIIAKHDGNIFMPLYQKEGRDGFFIIEPVE